MMKIPRAVLKRVGYCLVGVGLALLLALCGGTAWLGWGQNPGAGWANEVPSQGVQGLLAQGRDRFQRGQLAEAATLLETALAQARQQNDALGEAMVLSNLALVYGQQGQWSQANSAIAASLEILDLSAQADPNWQRVRAQTLNVYGRLQLGQGDAEAAYTLWGQTAAAYMAAGDRPGTLRSQLRQARALRAMGFYRRARD